jgi:hypothetical protein
MKRDADAAATTQSKPVKVLLHMARAGGDWAGKAADISHNQQCQFRSLKELMGWLDQRQKGG